jgi:hypothetical protein
MSANLTAVLYTLWKLAIDNEEI